MLVVININQFRYFYSLNDCYNKIIISIAIVEILLFYDQYNNTLKTNSLLIFFIILISLFGKFAQKKEIANVN